MARTQPVTTNGQTQPGAEPTGQEAEPALIDQRQRIGPAIRQLRQQQGRSLSDLAQDSRSKNASWAHPPSATSR